MSQLSKLKFDSVIFYIPLALGILQFLFIIMLKNQINNVFLNTFNYFIISGFYFTYVLYNDLNLDYSESLIFCIVTGLLFNMFSGIILTIIGVAIKPDTLTMCYLIADIFIILSLKNNVKRNNKSEYNRIEVFLQLFGLIFSFILACFLCLRSLPPEYWKGWDTWFNTPIVVDIITKKYSPMIITDIYGLNVAISGFFYSISTYYAFTGVDLYYINRFGGVILSGLVGSLTFSIIKRRYGFIYGILAPFILFLSPFFVSRFNMTIRENLSFVFFLSLILLFTIKSTAKEKIQNSKYYQLCLSLVTSSIIITNILTGFIATTYITLINLKDIYYSDNSRKNIALVYFLILIFSIPYINVSAFYFLTKTYTNWILITKNFSLLISLFLFFIFIIYNQKNLIIKYKDIFYNFILFVLFLGALYAIIIPHQFEVLGFYQPKILLNDYSIAALILSLIGFFISQPLDIKDQINNLLLIIVALFNVTNINIAFPIFRFNIYLIWIISYFSIKGLNHLYVNSNKFIIIKINDISRSFRIKQAYFVILFIAILITPSIVYDYNSITIQKSYYDQEDITSANIFKNEVLQENDVIIPQQWLDYLLKYAGVANDKLLEKDELYTTKDILNFNQTIKELSPNAERAIIYSLTRKGFLMPYKPMLEAYTTKTVIGSSTIYIFDLEEKLDKIPVISEPTELNFAKGPQLFELNYTQIAPDYAKAIELKILNNGTAKTFFIQINDENQTSLLYRKLDLQEGENNFIIKTTLQEQESLIKIATIKFNFSWWDSSEIKLTIHNLDIMKQSK